MTTITKKIILTGQMVLFCSLFLFGQSNKVWEHASSGNVLWQEVTSLGKLVVCTDTGLSGIDIATGQVIWSKAEFASLPQSSYKAVANSPFISVKKGDRIYLLEPYNGAILFDSKKAGIATINSYHFLYRNNGILVDGIKVGAKEPLMIFVDMSDGSIQWNIEEKFGKIIAVNELSETEILLVTIFKIYKINTSNGNIEWKNDTSKEVAEVEKMGAFGGLMKQMAENAAEDMEFDIRFYQPAGKDVFYIGSESEEQSSMSSSSSTVVNYSNQYNAFNLKDGSLVWDKPLKAKGKLGQVTFLDGGILVLPDNGSKSKINLYDYTTSKGKWGKKGKGINVKGGVYDYVSQDNGYLLITSNGQNNFLSYLDSKLGQLTFDKPVKIKGRVVGTIPSNKGIVYITTEEINLLNTNSGSLVLPKSINTQPNLTAEKDGQIYAFDLKDKTIKAIDIASGSVRNLSKGPIKFEGKEVPKDIEIRANGIFINSDQNVALVDFDGNLKFWEYYPAPRESGLKRALMYAQGIRAAYIGANAYYASAQLKSVEQEVKSEDAVAGAMVEGFGDMYEDLGNAASDFVVSSFQEANARFKATQEGRDFLIILSNQDKNNLLLKVSKNDGSIMGSIGLGKEKDPKYAVDDITGQVYLRKDRTTIYSYKF